MGKSKVKLRRLIARYLYPIVNMVYDIKIRFTNFEKHPPILILTAGKVGSSSIYETLKVKVKNPVFHIHQISEKGINNSISEHLHSDRKSIPLHLIMSKFLKKKLESYKGKLYVINIVREPISREISSFFQNTEFYKNAVETSKLDINVEGSLEILNRIFKNDITSELESWYDREIKSVFGIDVFDENFVFNNDMTIVVNGEVHLLLLKMESMNDVFPKAIQQFLQTEEMQIDNSNVSENKHYAKSYQVIKEQFRLPTSMLDEITNSRYFQKFYKLDKEKIEKKWS